MSINSLDQKIIEKISKSDCILKVLEELHQGIKKNGSFNSTHEGLGALTEEYYELIMAIHSNNIDSILKEAAQVSAIAMNFLIDFGEENE